MFQKIVQNEKKEEILSRNIWRKCSKLSKSWWKYKSIKGKKSDFQAFLSDFFSRWFSFRLCEKSMTFERKAVRFEAKLARCQRISVNLWHFWFFTSHPIRTKIIRLTLTRSRREKNSHHCRWKMQRSDETRGIPSKFLTPLDFWGKIFSPFLII